MNLIMPLASLAIGLRIWRLIHHHGWHRVLPALDRYLAFYCVPTVLLLPFACWNWYPQRMRGTMCIAYSYGYDADSLLALGFFLAVAYELIAFTDRTPSRRPLRAISILFGAVLAGIIALGLVVAVISRWSSDCCAFEIFTRIITKSGTIIVTALLLALWLLKRTLGVIWGGSISMIVLGPSIWYATEIIGFFVDFHYGGSTRVSAIGIQVSGLTWLIFWWLAVRTSPQRTMEAGIH